MGDGILATFDGPARAIRCGLAIRDGARQLGLDVRVGLHTGEVEAMGDDIGGLAVHIGERVQRQRHRRRGAGLAHGGGPRRRIGYHVRVTAASASSRAFPTAGSSSRSRREENGEEATAHGD